MQASLEKVNVQVGCAGVAFEAAVKKILEGDVFAVVFESYAAELFLSNVGRISDGQVEAGRKAEHPFRVKKRG